MTRSILAVSAALMVAGCDRSAPDQPNVVTYYVADSDGAPVKPLKRGMLPLCEEFKDVFEQPPCRHEQDPILSPPPAHAEWTKPQITKLETRSEGKP